MFLKKLFAPKSAPRAVAPAMARPTSALADPLTMPEAAKDDVFRAQPAHIQQFLIVLHRIVRDALLVGDILRRTGKLPQIAGPAGTVPIYCRDIETLFEIAYSDGTKGYRTYHYTHDLNTMDPRAQLHLSQFFGRVMALNMLLSAPEPTMRAGPGPAVRAMLDRILLEALCFKGFFSGFAITRTLLTTQNPDRDMLAAFEGLVARTKADLAAASPYLDDADTAFQALPLVNQSLIVELTKCYEVGQIVVNGVYFDAKTGAHVVAEAQGRQSAIF